MKVATYRPARPEDQAYVASTWVMSMSRGRHGRNVQALRMLVDRVLDRPDVTVTIAADPKVEQRIIGWLAFTRMVSPSLIMKPRHVVHYGYVRDENRRRGVLTGMLAASSVDLINLVYTFEGPSTKALAKTLLENAVHIAPHTFLESR